jgi:hypothetical protein
MALYASIGLSHYQHWYEVGIQDNHLAVKVQPLNSIREGSRIGESN